MKSIAGSIITLSGAMIVTFGQYQDDTLMMLSLALMITGVTIIFMDKPGKKKSDN